MEEVSSCRYTFICNPLSLSLSLSLSLLSLSLSLSLACHVFHCPDSTAQLVLASVGQAFELRYKRYLGANSKGGATPVTTTPTSYEQYVTTCIGTIVFSSLSPSVSVDTPLSLLFLLSPHCPQARDPLGAQIHRIIPQTTRSRTLHLLSKPSQST